MPGPLQGIKVLDLSRILAGPWATQTLADFGAEVTKIEKPGVGDDTRHWGPPNLHQDPQADAVYFLAANRGKRSLTLDLASDFGQAVIRQLVAEADVLVENFKVGGLARYGLDYSSLKLVNPALVYCSITGFGQTGPDAGKAGYDAMIQAMGGLMSLTGEADGPPQKVGVAVADLMTGLYAVSAITAALYSRSRTGEGQHIDLALFDTQVACLANQAMNYLNGQQLPQRQGSAHPNIAPYQPVRTKDGYLMLAVGNDQQFGRLCEMLEVANLSGDPRFATNAARVAHRETLIEQLETRLCGDVSEVWLHRLAEAGIPSGPINNLEQVFESPQLAHRQMLVTMAREDGKDIFQVANPVKFSETQVEYQKPPPALSADSQAILKELGINDETIADARKRGHI